MVWLDARIPVRFGTLATRLPVEAVIAEAAVAPGAEPWVTMAGSAGGHAVGCTCCVARSGAAVALAELFRARAVGAGPGFAGVLAVVGPEAEQEVRAALASDPVVSARFRLG